MKLLSDRVKKIIEEMEGRDYEKQSALAEIAGVSRTLVEKWLIDTESMDYRCGKQISEKLGYRMDWLMSGTGAAREARPTHTQPQREPKEQIVSSQAMVSNDLFLMHVTTDEMRLLTFCRTYPEAGKTFQRMAVDLTGNPNMK
jgi:hypothetical protein